MDSQVIASIRTHGETLRQMAEQIQDLRARLGQLEWILSEEIIASAPASAPSTVPAAASALATTRTGGLTDRELDALLHPGDWG